MYQKINDYVLHLIRTSSPEKTAWNIERARQGLPATWNYIDGCMLNALLEMAQITGDGRFSAFVEGFIDSFVSEDGTIRTFQPEKQTLDDINEGRVLFPLYRMTGKEKYRRAIQVMKKALDDQPRTAEGSFWHKKIYPHQVWLDGLYMVMPFYMEYETKFNNKKHYDDIFNQFENVVKHLRDEKSGLYFHAYDASKTAFWCDKETGLCQNFWLRALGWYSMALLDTLDKCDVTVAGEQYDKLKDVFVDYIDSLLVYQDESGMWYQLPSRAGEPGNYLETSGTAIFAYSLLKAVRLGLLPESYGEPAVKAFQAIMDKYLTVDDSGAIHLGGICLVAGLGPEDNRRRDGSYEYYMSEPIVSDDAKGVAPFLLAYTEVRRI